MSRTTPIRIAIFASGGGSNARELLKWFQVQPEGEIACLLTNNPQSGVHALGQQFEVPVIQMDPATYRDGSALREILTVHQVDLIVLAGYLKHIPNEVVAAFPRRMVNIHPSLLPDFGGKGMYGLKVHQAAIEAGVAVSGLTIHFVNEVYDEGEVIFQQKVSVQSGWEAKELQQAVLQQEHIHFPRVIQALCQQMRSMKSIRSALISVYHKQGLERLVKVLNQHGVQVYSTGGSAEYLRQQGAEVHEVADLTGYPSILGGRVKTLHPKVHGGILARREVASDAAELAQYEIPAIDLVVVDLYPFEETVASGASEEAIIEKIDIGGIALIRAAAKNFKDVVCVPSVKHYDALAEVLEQQGGQTNLEQRKHFAGAAFDVSSHYDTHIHRYLQPESPQLKLSIQEPMALRYGENPHQKGSFYGELAEQFEQLNGKPLSYNNLVDMDGALQLVDEFPDQPFFAIIKHTNPCGCAIGENLLDAWKKALAGDPVSAFGGILACDGVIDEALAQEMHALFFEVLIAKDFTPEALAILTKKKNRRLLKRIAKPALPPIVRNAAHGYLVQERDEKRITQEELEIKTSSQASEQAIADALFGDLVCKHLKSNAIAIVKDQQLIGSGVGQTSRIDALQQAIQKAKDKGFDLAGSVLASDAFFPFSDSVETAHSVGIKTVIQPGGSVRDEDSIKFCETHDMCLIFTGIRHFKH
ncbi:MAG: bifunctional phosphoribosylaminoimidazolecarboxamide formyltransferase/IMP cyclohydrolase [Bacteroidota bacterium]